MKKGSTNFATLILVGSLRNFPIPDGRQSLELTFELKPSVKDLIESKGIPHTAIFRLEINGKEEFFDYNLQDGDQVTAYPFEETDSDQWEPIFLRPSAFIADVHLGKLAKSLRLLGFDTSFDNNWDDPSIIRQSNQQRRMILTRDIEMLKNGKARYGYWIRSTDPDEQIRELFNRFSLANNIHPFSRCMKCNGKLCKVPLDHVQDKVPPKVKNWHSDFWECDSCGQVYWQGSHFEKLNKKVEELKKISG